MLSPRPYLVASVEHLARPSSHAREIHPNDREELGVVTAEALASTPDRSDRQAHEWAEDVQRELLQGPLPGGALVIEASDGEIDAFIASHILWGRPFVSHLMTRPRAQNRGYGSELLRAVADAARRAGHAEISLIVTRENPAFLFYRRLGLEERSRPQ